MTESLTPQPPSWASREMRREAPEPSSRRRWAGLLLIGGGLALAAAEIIHPRGGDDVFAVSIAESRQSWTAWGLLIMATALLQLPAVVSLRSMVSSGRGSRLTAIGGAVLFVSLVALFAFGQAHAEAATLVGPAPVSADLLEAFTRTESDVSLGVTAVLALFGFHLGWPLLFAGLARAGRLPKPLGIVGGASVFLSIFGAVLGPLGETALFVLAAACISAAGTYLMGGLPWQTSGPTVRASTGTN